MTVKADLQSETIKWTKRIEKEIKKAKAKNKKGEALLENVRAYIDDSKYFAKKGDPIRAFEAIIWAWAWLEILRELDVLV
ncbi:MAG: DUF357 domain-containing protein [Candidatus Aenigmatarchaeota archaeon]